MAGDIDSARRLSDAGARFREAKRNLLMAMTQYEIAKHFYVVSCIENEQLEEAESLLKWHEHA